MNNCPLLADLDNISFNAYLRLINKCDIECEKDLKCLLQNTALPNMDVLGSTVFCNFIPLLFTAFFGSLLVGYILDFLKLICLKQQVLCLWICLTCGIQTFLHMSRVMSCSQFLSCFVYRRIWKTLIAAPSGNELQCAVYSVEIN